MSEVVMCDLVGDDDLMAHEEAVLEAVVEWIKGGEEEEGRGESLLGEIRYGLLTALRLEEVGLRVEEMVGEGLGARLRARRWRSSSCLQRRRRARYCAAEPSSHVRVRM